MVERRRGRGDGGIAQRHDHSSCPPVVDGVRPQHRCQGRWVATLDLGWSGGKRRRKTFYGRTRKEAQMKLAAAQRDASQLVVGAPTVETWLRYWLDVVCVERGLKVNTMKSHRSKVERYLIPYLGRHRLDKLTPEHLRYMYADMRQRGLSEATLRQTHAVLRRALTVAEREDKVGRNVAAKIDPPKTTTNRREGLTLDQARRVLAATDDARWWLALYLGLRQGEALGLRWSDIDLDRAVLYVGRAVARKPGAGLVFDVPKSAASVRAVPIPGMVLARLRLAEHERKLSPSPPPVRIWHETRREWEIVDDLVFHRDGQPIDPRHDWQEWTDLLVRATRAPWAPIPHVALHAARNTTASLLEAAGVPDRVVAQILGQSTVQVTHGYQHADVERLRTAMAALEEYVAERPALGG